MKKVYLLLLALGSATVTFGQKMEYSAQLNSGLSRFIGESATRNTTLVIFQQSPWEMGAQTMNPYGSRYNVTYGASLQGQYVTEAGFLLGAQAGYEQMRSRAKIEHAYGYWSHSSSTHHPADGKAVMIANTINLQPYIGWRMLKGATDLDLTLGSDVALNHRMQEKMEATVENDGEFKGEREHSVLAPDFRPRLGLTAFRGHFGASLSYAHGIKNHRANWDGGNPKLYTQVIRLGLLYRL